MMSSPLIVDCDVTTLNGEVLDILKASALIDVHQDEDGRPARIFSEGVYVKYLEDSKYAVAFINTADEEKKFDFYAYDFGITWNAGYALKLCSVFGAEECEFDAMTSVTVPAGDAKPYRLSLV